MSRLTSAATKNITLLSHATSEIGIGSKLGINATRRLPGEGFKRPWPPLIKMDEKVRAQMNSRFGKAA
jgi:4-hydroxy-3-polyprenylbenzoate decarboxylase